jgi:imidazolonepropionase-like amidohydrolase
LKGRTDKTNLLITVNHLIVRKEINYLIGLSFIAIISGACSGVEHSAASNGILLKNALVIDGNGGTPVQADILIHRDTITAIGTHLDTSGVQVLDLTGKTIMPALISTHVHIGILKDTANRAENYTRDNILAQLKKYEDYGVGTLLVMGTDRPLLFANGLKDSAMNGLLPGARIYSAGYGFGVPQGAPPMEMAMDQVFRPADSSRIPAEMDSLAILEPAVVKLWLDDFGGKYKKMDPSVYRTIIREAHKRNLRVAAHVYYLADARMLVSDGVDILGHSIRDSVIDDNLLQEMKTRKVVYIPTLSLDEFAYIYARRPEWINDPFFRTSLEPGVYEMITSPQYQDKLKKSPNYKHNVTAFNTALKNLKRIHDAGILISLGTDSGAMPLRAQGFSEHLELELMVKAGLTPLEAITVATKNASQVLRINDRYGSLEKGKVADLIVLNGNPVNNIKNTRSIMAVYKSGKQVSNGPLSVVKQ